MLTFLNLFLCYDLRYRPANFGNTIASRELAETRHPFVRCRRAGSICFETKKGGGLKC